MKRTTCLVIGGVFLMGITCWAATITIDENGNGIGTVGPGFLGNDPGPGGRTGVLIYNLPFAGLQGDVFMTDAGVILDVLRFNGNGTVIFYSDTPPADAIADTPAPPAAFYANTFTIAEVGPEGNNGALYTPTPNQPGFTPGAAPISYNFISDGAIPEPGSIVLLLSGMGLMGLGAARHKVRA